MCKATSTILPPLQHPLNTFLLFMQIFKSVAMKCGCIKKTFKKKKKNPVQTEAEGVCAMLNHVLGLWVLGAQQSNSSWRHKEQRCNRVYWASDNFWTCIIVLLEKDLTKKNMNRRILAIFFILGCHTTSDKWSYSSAVPSSFKCHEEMLFLNSGTSISF